MPTILQLDLISNPKFLNLWTITQLLSLQDFSLNTFWHSLIVSCTILSSFVFSLFGSWTSDRFGRRKTVLIASVAFTVGSFLMGLASGKGKFKKINSYCTLYISKLLQFYRVKAMWIGLFLKIVVKLGQFNIVP